MSDDNSPVVCRACNRTTTMKDIKFDANKKAYVCKNCYTAPAPMTMEEKTDSGDEKTAEKMLANMIKYNCPKCKYHFQRPAEKEVKECPYCGNKVVEQANKDAADKILSESEGWD